MATHDTIRPTRRALLTGAAATLPAVPAFALPAVILPRETLGEALHKHIDVVARTLTPFAAMRGADDWRFTVTSGLVRGIGASVTLAFDSDELNRNGSPRPARLEVYDAHEGGLDQSIFLMDGSAPVCRRRVDFTL